MRASWLLATGMALTLACGAAEARRFRFFPIPRFHSGASASSTREAIEPVHTLPDTDAFRRDGDHYDIGLLYRQTRSADGASSDDRSDGRYVLYHDNRYMKLDSEGQELVAGALGFDPIARHRERLAQESGTRPSTAYTLEPRAGESRGEFRARALAKAAELTTAAPKATPAAPANGGSGVGTAMLGLLIAGGLLLVVRKLIRAEPRPTRFDWETAAMSDDFISFDTRVAASKRALADTPAAPAARTGFGRRVA